MKLTRTEYQNIVDSRLVDLEDEIENYKSNEPIVNDSQNINNLKMIVARAEQLLEAYEATVEAEEEKLAKEAEEKYKKNFLGEDDASN